MNFWRLFVKSRVLLITMNITIYFLFSLARFWQLPFDRIKLSYWSKKSPNLYFGALKRKQVQRVYGGFIGLSLRPIHFFEIKCDVSKGSLPFYSGSISKIQAEDVLEHIQLALIPELLNEIYRVLKPGGIFRLSVPDYNSIVLRKRSIYNYKGEVIADPLTGSSIYYNSQTESIEVKHRLDGNSHLWFPTKSLLDNLVEASSIRNCTVINFWHFSSSSEKHSVEKFPDMNMPIFRCPPNDMRANGLPVSIVVDFVK